MGIFLFLGTACALLLVGCGEGSSTPSTDPGSENAILTSIFVDSPVQGVIYTTQTLSGITNASEEFGYLAGEQVTFSIGATQLPAVLAASQVTPIDIAAGSANPAVMTTNIARLLQSLDMDGNPNNGITIPETVATSEASLDFDMGTDDFADDAAVINLVANSGSTNTMLISAEAANLHLSETLDAIKGDGSTIPEDEILLDLRDTVWIVDHNASSCPTAGNQQILRYSQTRFSGESTSYDENCEVSTQSWDSAFSEIGTGFMFICGGDARCTYDEINRIVSLTADDPRNGCNDVVSQPRPVTRHITNARETLSWRFNEEGIYCEVMFQSRTKLCFGDEAVLVKTADGIFSQFRHGKKGKYPFKVTSGNSNDF